MTSPVVLDGLLHAKKGVAYGISNRISGVGCRPFSCQGEGR